MQSAVLSDLGNDSKSPASLVLSLIPVVGEGYDIVTLFNGQDPITKEQLTPLTKTFTFIGLLSGAGSGKAARDGVGFILRKVVDEFGVGIDVVYSAANNVVSKHYNFSSLTEIYQNRSKFTYEYFSNKVRVELLDRGVKLKSLGLGSTGRTVYSSLAEDIAMRSVKNNPELGTKLPISLTDPKWPSSEGWSKYEYIVRNNQGVVVSNIHYNAKVFEGRKIAVDDFKFKD